MPRYRPGATRRTVSSRSGAISENAVVYSSSGGHNHDGANSSLIDVNKYSLWDFTLNTIYSTNDRTSKQNSHIEQFRNYVTNIIINDAFGAAGVTLGDNVINANNIVSGSISTDLLRTDAITSQNFVYTSGDYSDSGTSLDLSNGVFRSENFAITSDGSGKFKGTLEAAGGSLASFKITSSALLTDGFSSGTTNTVGISGVSSSTYTSTGAIKIFNYGDVFIQSTPTTGPHNGQYHQTEIAGEYINIQEYGSNDFATSTAEFKFTFIGTLGNSSTDILGNDEHKVLVRSDKHYALALANDNGSLVGARQLNNDDTGVYSRADLQAFGNTPQLELNRRDDYTDSSSAFRSVYAAANSSDAYIELRDGTLPSSTPVVLMSTLNGGSLRVGSSSENYIYLYTEQDTAQIADTFLGNTDKSYINFNAASGSTDPGFILHETRAATETNEGVLHLCPSDDNSYDDYVSIHGTNDPDKIKLHTDGQIDGVTDLTASGTVEAEHFYSKDDAQIGDNTEYVYINSDSDKQIELVSNTTTGRPYIQFSNYNASNALTAKGYVGYPTAQSSGDTGLNVYSFVGDLSLYGAADIKMTSKTYFTSGNDVSLAADSGYVLIGSSSGTHLALDNNEIMAKSNGTTATTLNLNLEGGLVFIGNGGLSVGSAGIGTSGPITASGTMTSENIFINGTSMRKNNQSEDFTFDVYANMPSIYLWRNKGPESQPSAYDNQVVRLYNNNNNSGSVIGIGFALANGSGCVLRAWQGNTSASAYTGGSGATGSSGSGGDGLDVGSRSGGGYGFMGASAFVVRSSETIKQNIEYLPTDTRVKSVDRIKGLKPARWDDLVGAQKSIIDEETGEDVDVIDHICDNEDCGGTSENPCGVYSFHKGRYGFIAEDVAKVFPKAVQITDDNKPIGIDYAPITFSLVETVQVLLEEIEQLKAQIQELS